MHIQRKFAAMVFLSFLVLEKVCFALPQNLTVVEGEATTERPDADSLVITASDHAIIQFESFSIGVNETVRFIQPDEYASVLSQVTGIDSSEILGALFSNGEVVLYNPNGVHVGSQARIETGSFIASTLGIQNALYLQNHLLFEKSQNSDPASILNEGAISARDGGHVVLISGQTENKGMITAHRGTVVLGSAARATVSFGNNGLINFVIGEGVDQKQNPGKALVENSGTLDAKGGKVVLNAATLNGTLDALIKQTGIVEGGALVERNGVIELVANGAVEVQGQMKAGQVDVTARDIRITGATETQGNTTFAAENAIAVEADVTNDSGNLAFVADSDRNGKGTFTQAEGTTLRTTTFGDVTIQSSGESRIANIDSAGDLFLQKAGADVTYTQYLGAVTKVGGALHIKEGVLFAVPTPSSEVSQAFPLLHNHIQVAGDWINQGAFAAGNSMVELIGPLPAQVTGDNAFYGFAVVEPLKTVTFESGKTQEFTGSLTLRGEYGKLLNVKSSNLQQQALFSILGTYDIEFINLQCMTNVLNHGPPVQAAHSKNSLNNDGFYFDPARFLSAQSSHWSDPANWDGGFVPGSGDSVFLGNSAPDSVVDSAFSGSIQNLLLDMSYAGTLSLGRDLALSGDFNHQGGGFDAGTSTVEFTDASRPSTVYGDNAFYNLVSLTSDKVIRFEAGRTQTILGTFRVQGSFEHHVRLVSTEAGSRWLVDPQGDRDLSYAWVEDSHNLDPDLIIMTESTNRGNSVNWDPVGTWTGAVNANWSNTGNWSGLGGAAPGAGDDLVFPGGAANLSNTNDFVTGTLFNSITISGSGYILSGNDIILGAGAAGITDSTAAGSSTIALDMLFTVVRTVTVTNSGETLTISGEIRGDGGINKEGSGKLILSGANSFIGAVSINTGVLNIRNATALGTATAATTVLTGAALEIQGGIIVGPEGLTLSGTGVSSGGALRNISDSNTYGGAITQINANGATIASDSGALTLTGGVTGVYPLTIDGAGNTTFTTVPIAIGGNVLNKNGSGTLTYSMPYSDIGLTTINAGTLLYGTHNAIASGGITVNGGTLDIATFSDIVGTVTLTSGTVTGSTGVLSGTSFAVQNGTISAILGGDAATLTKSTTGTVVLTRANLYTGATSINAGTLTIQDAQALGALDGGTAVASGATLAIDGSGLSFAEPITSIIGAGVGGAGALRNLANNNTWTGAIGLSTTPTITSNGGTLTIGAGGFTGTTSGAAFDGAGNITLTTGAITLTTGTVTKNGTGTLTLQAVNPYSGATTINEGTLVLSGGGTIVNSAITINAGGTLTIDNSATNIVHRIIDGSAFTMNGGSFNFIGSSSGDSYEFAGVLTLSTGDNTITVTPGSGGFTKMIFSTFTRTAGAQALFRGASFGSTPAANVSTLIFTNAPTLTGGSGAENTTTISTIRGAFGDNSLTGAGTDMVTHNVGNLNGLRLLNGAGFSGEYLENSFGTTNANIKLTAATTAATATINSLILDAGGSVADAGSAQTLTFTTANILSLAGNAGIAGANTTVALGAAEGVIRMPANLSISSLITGTAGLTTGGAGTLTLSVANTYTGTTSINAGTLTYGVSDAINTGAVSIVGGTYNLAGFSDTIGALTMRGGSVTTAAGTLTLGGTVTTNTHTASATITGNLDLGNATRTFSIANGIVANDLVVSAILSSAGGAFGIAQTGAGTLVLTGNNTYTGTTSIAATGVLNIRHASALGTGTVTVTVASTGALQMQGGITADTTKTLSMAGTGVAADGALRSISGDNAWQGPIILNSTARINSGAGTLTISGGISGATIGLTVGGASNTVISGIIGTTSGTLTKDGVGILTLSGSSTYTGATVVVAGTLRLGAAGDATNTPLGTAAAGTTVVSGAVIDLNGFTLGTDEPLTIVGTGLAGGGALVNSSATAVTYSGLLASTSHVTVTANAGDINLTNAGTILGAADIWTLNGSGNGSISSIIGTTTGGITKTGNGTWTLSGSSTYTGLVRVNAGTLKYGIADAFSTNAVTVAGGTLDLAGFSDTVGVVTLLSGTITDSVGGGVLTGTSFVTESGTISAVLSGAVTLAKNTANTVTLNSANTLSGLTTVNAGILLWGVNDALGTGGLTVAGGTVNIVNFTDSVGTVTITGGTITGTSGVLTSTANFALQSGTVSAILSGTGIGIAATTAGTTTVTRANTFDGASSIAATSKLNVQHAGALGTGTVTVTVASTGVLQLQGGITIDTTKTLSLAGTGIATDGALRSISGINEWQGPITMTLASRVHTDNGTLTISGNISGATLGLTVSGLGNTVISGIIGTTSGTLIKSDLGTLTLSGNNTYTGLTTVSAGFLKLGAAGDGTNTPLGTTGAATTVSSGGVLDLNGFTLSTAEGLTLNGTGVSGGGALIDSSATNVSYSGLLVLGSAATITANFGDINLTNAGTTTGATFGLTIGGTGNGSIAGVIGTTSGTMTKTGTGTWTLSGSSTYTGLTTISAGTLKLGATGGAANTPLGTVGNGTVVSSGGVLDLNGFTLGTAEALTLNGTGILSGGALVNGSASDVTYSGLLTLGSDASIVAASGGINISNAGTITGATFGLTLGGATTTAYSTSVPAVNFSNPYSLSFDGTNDYVDLSTFALPSNKTYSLWVKATSLSAGYDTLIEGGNDSPWFGIAGTEVELYSNNPRSTSSITTGLWYHIAYTSDSGSNVSKIYINGVQDGPNGTASTQETTGVGIGFHSGDSHFSGFIDDVRIYSRVLTPAEITSLAGGDDTVSSVNLVGYWKFDEGSGTSATDSSGSGNTGTLTGGSSIASIIGLNAGTLTKTGAGIWTISGANTYAGATTIGAGTLKLGASGVLPDASAVTVTGTLDLNNKNETIGSLAGAGTVTSGATGAITLAVGADGTSTTFSGIIRDGSGTVSLTKSGAGALDLTSTVTLGGDLTVSAGSITGTANITVNGGDATGNGTINMTGGTFLVDGTGNFGGNTDWTFFDLTFGNGAGGGTITKTAGSTGNIVVSRDLAIAATQIFSADNDTYSVARNWSNAGTFTAGNSTVIFNGADQTITGATTFYNLTKTETIDNATNSTWTFPASTTIAATNAWTVDGLDGNDKILLVSSTPNTRWDINASGTPAIDNANVTDSNNISGTLIDEFLDTTVASGGNNLNWLFAPVIVPPASAGGGPGPGAINETGNVLAMPVFMMMPLGEGTAPAPALMPAPMGAFEQVRGFSLLPERITIDGVTGHSILPQPVSFGQIQGFSLLPETFTIDGAAGHSILPEPVSFEQSRGLSILPEEFIFGEAAGHSILPPPVSFGQIQGFTLLPEKLAIDGATGYSILPDKAVKKSVENVFVGLSVTVRFTLKGGEPPFETIQVESRMPVAEGDYTGEPAQVDPSQDSLPLFGGVAPPGLEREKKIR